MQKQFPKEKRKKNGVLTAIDNNNTNQHGNNHQNFVAKIDAKSANFEPHYKREFGVVEKILVIINKSLVGFFSTVLKKNSLTGNEKFV
jgi:hypothetical protein